MKRIFTLIFIISGITAGFTISSCRINCKHGSGHLVTETRQVSGFTSIDISGSYRVVVKQDSSAESLNITADDNLISDVKSDVVGGTLKIHSTHNICGSGQYVVNITLKKITGIATAGAITLLSDGKLIAKDIELNVSGASKLNLDLIADNLTTVASGLTDITLRGQATSHKVEGSGSTSINALDFVVSKYNIETSGMNHSRINVLNELNINSSGMSDIQYKGNPPNVNNDKSGIATLKHID